MVLIRERDKRFVVRSRLYPKRLCKGRKKGLIVRLHGLKWDKSKRLSRDFTFYWRWTEGGRDPKEEPLGLSVKPNRAW